MGFIDNIKEKKPRWLSLPLVIIVVFIGYTFFWDDNSYSRTQEHQRRINELNEEIQHNVDSAKFYERKLKELHTDHETLEKIAREQYGMKRDNEDVYITDIP